MNHHTVETIDTIAAQATPPGRGGIAVVRVSGTLVKAIMLHMFGKVLKPRTAFYTPFKDDSSMVIDEGLALFFPGPNSFTGEDVLELQGHGGPVIVDLLLERLVQLGVRLARPGEFSERAFLNGKIDLAQAEAIADLIHASSKQAARSAMKSLQGEFSSRINKLSEMIISLRMFVEAAIDFSDEEIDFLNISTIHKKLVEILQALLEIQQTAKQGSFLREGINVVIAGEPNVGKSSLLNALSGKELAIVTDIPGTTRDVLRNHILIDGMPLHIIDTAGLRLSNDLVEQEGIRRAHQEIEQADLVLYLVDDTKPLGQPLINFKNPVLLVSNKIDLTHNDPTVSSWQGLPYISISAKSGAGITLLKEQIKHQVGFDGENNDVFIARRRHLDALQKANGLLLNSETKIQGGHSFELAAEDLRLAHMALCEITGEFTADDLLGQIFSSFCIGK